MPEEIDAHCARVVKACSESRLVPFLGAGANLCDRPEDAAWTPGERDYLPDGGELARYLAGEFAYPDLETEELARVSQFAAVKLGTGPLFAKLRSVLDEDFPPTTLHRFLASLSATLHTKGYSESEDPLGRRMLVVTTNYDDLLERAFVEARQPFHVVTYEAEGEHRGKFFHSSPEAPGARLIEEANTYRGLLSDGYPVILKIHGTVDRIARQRDSFVITEDHYIDYLARTDISALMPVPLPGILKESHLLFLGYGLRDWNLRVILHRVWGHQKLSWKSWAIQRASDELERESWRKRNVEILEVDLGEYVERLSARLADLEPVGDGG